MSELYNFYRIEQWKNFVRDCIAKYETAAQRNVPDSVYDKVCEFMDGRLDRYIKKGNLVSGLVALCTTFLLKIELEKLDKEPD